MDEELLVIEEHVDVVGLLIEVIQQYEYLYDLSHKDYKNTKKKELAWKEISDITNVSGSCTTTERVLLFSIFLLVEDCMKQWKALRDRFTREKRMKPSGSEGAESSWIHLEKMAFYNNCTRPRKTHTSTISVVKDSPSSSRTSSRSSVWSGIETILSPQSEEEAIEETADQTIVNETASTPIASKTKKVQSSTSKRGENELAEVIETAKKIASSLDTRAIPPNQNRTFVEYVYSRLSEMPSEQAKEKRRSMLRILEDLE
ncbi:transcription factor Adf-1-like isoform X1 [Photinus pyralis]|uniref:transcription factor Adf-1-like isoform X1 n=1 Tax=Photinus pyralis TaxID=7054 RepID=UPI001267043A|nr:transcription factor Adf-1-like isoform X1 [Photinus pyralis]